MKAIRPLGLVLVLGLTLAAQEPAEDRFGKLFRSILPREEELAWQKIPWRSELGAAVEEAHRQDKPILFWAMNGHPLACT